MFDKIYTKLKHPNNMIIAALYIHLFNSIKYQYGNLNNSRVQLLQSSLVIADISSKFLSMIICEPNAI